jgi:hypothetical protein
LEDEPGKLSLRGRLFEGATDVHEALNSQCLQMLGAVGLLIELAATRNPAVDKAVAVAAAAKSGEGEGAAVSSSSSPTRVHPTSGLSPSSPEHGIRRQAAAAFLVRSQPLLVLLPAGVQLHLHGSSVIAAGTTSVQAVRQLLRGASAATAAVEQAHSCLSGSGSTTRSAAAHVPVSSSSCGVRRAGVCGRLSPQPLGGTAAGRACSSGQGVYDCDPAALTGVSRKAPAARQHSTAGAA